MELREGYCNYCKQGKMVNVSPDATQEEVNQKVTDDCGCRMASKVRQIRQQREDCIDNIHEIFGEKQEEVQQMFIESISPIQENKIKKITVNTYGGYTYRIGKTKDGIKVEMEKKEKAENLA